MSTCKECVFFHFYEKERKYGGTFQVTECRRFPRQSICEGEAGDINSSWDFPYAGEDEWCGEFKALARASIDAKTREDE